MALAERSSALVVARSGNCLDSTVPTTKIRIIVSDLGKVLLPFDVERAWSVLLPHFGIPLETARDTFRKVNRDCRIGVGGSTGVEFHRRLAQEAGLALTYEAFCIAWSDMFWEDEAVLRLISDAPVEARYLLSNTNEIHWGFIRERYPHILSPFDRLIVSHEVGLEKPDAAIYEAVIGETGLPAAAHLFIDDIQENVEGAQAVGMDAVLHTDAVTLWEAFHQRGLATEAQRPTLPPPTADLWTRAAAVAP